LLLPEGIASLCYLVSFEDQWLMSFGELRNIGFLCKLFPIKGNKGHNSLLFEGWTCIIRRHRTRFCILAPKKKHQHHCLTWKKDSLPFESSGIWEQWVTCKRPILLYFESRMYEDGRPCFLVVSRRTEATYFFSKTW
jgi:hypothetical protein